MKLDEKHNADYIAEIKEILFTARQGAYSAVNFIMVRAYWLVGRKIVLEEQNGKERAEYGKQVIKNVSKELIKDFDKNFDERRVREVRQFYIKFSSDSFWHSVSAKLQDAENLPVEKRHSVNAELDLAEWFSLDARFETEIQHLLFTRLSWTHIRYLLRVTDEKALLYYIQETVANNWATRTLDRNIATQYYERLLLSQTKNAVQQEMKEKTSNFHSYKYEFIKNPSVLEFLNLPVNIGYTESELEKAIIDNLQHFLLELGKGYAFVERQKLIRTETRDYRIDLVFYNYILKCFVLIDLKTERITHQDVGQMDMYVRMYNEREKQTEDNPTLGIVLCSETDNDIARYSILHGNEQIFASKYKLYLPTEEELKAEIEREKLNFELQMKQKSEAHSDVERN